MKIKIGVDPISIVIRKKNEKDKIDHCFICGTTKRVLVLLYLTMMKRGIFPILPLFDYIE